MPDDSRLIPWVVAGFSKSKYKIGANFKFSMKGDLSNKVTAIL
jgi:hypothetical protein